VVELFAEEPEDAAVVVGAIAILPEIGRAHV
jgi:hypothetical protein